MKIKIKYHDQNCKLESYGNWIDLTSEKEVVLKQFENTLVSLGISIKLPKYYQANIVPRSGTFKKFGVIQTNHYGVVDTAYSGNNDIYMMSIWATRDTLIPAYTRICQFEIRPTMNAPWYVKLRWIFDNKIEFIEVNDLGDNNRGGFGSTGN